MTDMLVKLYALPEVNPYLTALAQQGIEIRKPYPTEKYVISEWVRQHFTDSSWAIGCEVALENRPVSCYIAVQKNQTFVPGEDPYDLPDEVLIGFACYDVGNKGMVGPLGVHAPDLLTNHFFSVCSFCFQFVLCYNSFRFTIDLKESPSWDVH